MFDSARNLYEGRELVLNAFKSGLFPSKSTEGTGLKILTPKQMLQRLPIALAQVKSGSNSEHLLNEIRQIVYSLYQSKEITEKVFKMDKKYKMGTIFTNLENSKTSKPHDLILKLTDKLDLRRGEKSIPLSNLSIYYTWRNIKKLIQQ